MIILRYKTSYWIPPIAEVTLRTQLNEWKDLPGRYEDGGWTFELPEAQLDRFMLFLKIGYPQEADELAMLASTTRNSPACVEPVTVQTMM